MKIKILLAFLLAAVFTQSARGQCGTFTPNLNLGTPAIGQTSGWGSCLNTDLTALDGILGGTYTLTVNATSPSVAGHMNWLTANTSATVITNFTGGFQGQVLRLLCGDANTTMVSGPNLTLGGSFSCAPGSQTSVTLLLNGLVWHELARSPGGSGTGGSPGAPVGSLQFNSGGVLGGTAYQYNGNDTTDLICASPCASIQTTVNSGIQLSSPSGLNVVVFNAQDGVFGAGITVISSVTNPGSITQGQGSQSFIGGNTSGGSCFSPFFLGGTPPCARAYSALPGDIGTETFNGQDLTSFSSGPLLNKGGGFTVNTVAHFVALTPASLVGTSIVPVTEHTVNTFGFYCLDQGGFSTTEQACIKGNSQTTPGAGAKFFIDAAVGSGKNFLGDGLTLGGSLNPASTVVGSLPSAAANAGAVYTVTDSTTVSAEGQTCVGGSGNNALAYSNGTVWKCF